MFSLCLQEFLPVFSNCPKKCRFRSITDLSTLRFDYGSECWMDWKPIQGMWTPADPYATLTVVQSRWYKGWMSWGDPKGFFSSHSYVGSLQVSKPLEAPWSHRHDNRGRIDQGHCSLWGPWELLSHMAQGMNWGETAWEGTSIECLRPLPTG